MPSGEASSLPRSTAAIVAFGKILHEYAQDAFILAARLGLPALRISVPRPCLARCQHARKSSVAGNRLFDGRRVEIVEKHLERPLHRRVGAHLMLLDVAESLFERPVGTQIACRWRAEHD